MKKPILIIMAAGMGSRYGGLKQIDPISDQGEIILDFLSMTPIWQALKRPYSSSRRKTKRTSAL